MQYLVILLDKSSPAYCHADNDLNYHELISLEHLRLGIEFAMKNNLMVQYILPDFKLPDRYIEMMNTIDSHIFVSSTCSDSNAVEVADVIIFDDWRVLDNWNYDPQKMYILRTKTKDLFERYTILNSVLPKVDRLNIVISDIEIFTENDTETYKSVLSDLSDSIKAQHDVNHLIQVNIITDRIMLDKMNNCNAGVENVTLAPNGKFYLCQGFYYDECNGVGAEFFGNDFSIGNLENGLCIRNHQLLKLSNAPICRNCDAYQCKRCVWLNHRTTREVNIPGRAQCVIAHIERNVSRALSPNTIPEINYSDPLEILV